LAVTGGRITVEIVEDREDRACVLSYTLGRDLNPLDLTPSDRFEAVHHQLEQDGTLDHPLTAQEIDRLRTGVTVIRYAPLVPGNRGPEPEARGRDSR
jgi:hypothetical protein